MEKRGAGSREAGSMEHGGVTKVTCRFERGQGWVKPTWMKPHTPSAMVKVWGLILPMHLMVTRITPTSVIYLRLEFTTRFPSNQQDIVG